LWICFNWDPDQGFKGDTDPDPVPDQNPVLDPDPDPVLDPIQIRFWTRIQIQGLEIQNQNL
jgi:hypothetical protein